MKTLSIIICSVAAVGALAVSIHQTSKIKSQWQADARASKSKLDAYTSLAESNQEVIVSLQRQADQVQTLIALTNSLEAQLTAANERIKSYDDAKQAQEIAAEMALVPPPLITNTVLFFPQVVSVNNVVLTENATFAYLTGRRVIFRPQDGMPVAIDVDNLHPLMLKYLGIDPVTAKQNQQQIDASWAERKAMNDAYFAEYQKSLENENERNYALQIAKQKADADTAAAIAAQRQANADAEQAQAAMINATKPVQPTTIIVQQQQQQQTSQRPNTYWSH
jgi:hypothetical protein